MNKNSMPPASHKKSPDIPAGALMVGGAGSYFMNIIFSILTSFPEVSREK